MEPKQEEKPSRAELQARVAKFRELLGDKLKDHKEGDAEALLLREYSRRRGSHAKQDR